jgi:small glutamine-rich tetratricopeptide repeat-containing protein alpha
MGDYKSAVSAFQKGLALDPNNDNMKLGLQSAKAQVDAHPEPTPASVEPDPGAGLGGIADMLRNMGGVGGAGAGAGAGGRGGMPDLASMMNDPMMRQMAQQMMQNGGLERLASNPAVANIVKLPNPPSFSPEKLTNFVAQVNRARSGGGMPSMEEIMADPTLRDLYVFFFSFFLFRF